MTKFIPPPSDIKDRAVYDYLYKLQEYLRVAVGNLGSGIGGEGATLSGGTVVVAGGSSAAAKQSQYEELKALIIKTAEEVEARTQFDLSGLRTLINNMGDMIEQDEITLANIQKDYVAVSDFGTYKESITHQLSLLGDSINQNIGAISQLKSNVDAVSTDFHTWLMETQGYIRSGIVGYREDSTPIIGIAIGQDLKVVTDASGKEKTETVTLDDGRTIEAVIIRQESFRAIYAADELSFWNGPNKIAYMNGNRLYITNVVAVNSLQIGPWSIKDDGVNGLTIKWIGGAS